MKSSRLPERLRRWREEHGLSYRRFAEALNEHLPKGSEVSYVTLRDWEQEGAAGPRPEVLEALKKAYPELRLEWLLFGEGRARRVEEALSERVSEFEEIELSTELGSKLYRIPRWPTIRSLPTVSRQLFLHVVAELFHTASDLDDLDEEQRQSLLGKLALAVQDLLMIPLHSWGFQRIGEMDRRQYEAYTLAMLQALSLAVGPAGQGRTTASYDASLMSGIQDLLEGRLELAVTEGDEDDQA